MLHTRFSASILFFASSLTGCTGTNVTPRDEVPVPPHEEASTSYSIDAATDEGDWIAGQFEAVRSIEAALSAGSLEDARRELENWVAGGVESVAVGLDADRAAELYRRVAHLAEATASLDAQRDALEVLHDLHERLLPNNHPDLLAAKYDLARVYYSSDDFEEALALMEFVHSARERDLPADHPDLLSAKLSLAAVLGELGDTKRALALEEHVHAIRERLLPADHPDLLKTKRNLARSRGALGDVAGALELFEQLHELRSRLLPPEHQDLLNAKQDLGTARHACGDLAGANELFEYIHTVQQRLLPAEHPVLMRAKNNLAVTRGELGDLAGALALKESVHGICERILPAEHPELLAAKQNLAAARFELGDRAGALELYEHVHSVRERLLSAGHPDLLETKLNLAVVRKAFGDFRAAREIIEDVHAQMERALSPEHPTLLAAKVNLAVARKQAGDIEGALELEEQVHAHLERSAPADHPALLGAKSNLALTRSALGDFAGALALQEEVHTLRERLLPAEHPDLLDAKCNLGGTRMQLGDVNGAVELFEHVHTLRERTLRADHPDLLIAKSNLAWARKALGDLAGAHELQKYVNAAWERSLPADHPDLLRVQLNLASTRLALGDFEGANELVERVHVVSEQSLPAGHPQLLRVKQHLAVSRRALGDLSGANEILMGVVEMLEPLVPADHSVLLDTKQNLAATFMQLGDLEGLRQSCASLLASQAALAVSLTREAPRPARGATLRELGRFAISLDCVTCLRAEGGSAFETELFEVLEGLRAAPMRSGEARRAAALAPDLSSRIEELGRTRRQLAEASQSAPSDAGTMEAWRERLVQLSSERDRLERALQVALAELGLESELPTVERLASTLHADAAVISYLRCPRHVGQGRLVDSLIAFVVTADSVVRFVELGPAAPIEGCVFAWRASLGQPIEARAPGLGIASPDDEERTRSTGIALRSLILDPILTAVPEATSLNVVLDDVLFLTPLDALPLDGGLVGDRYVIRSATTALQLLPTPESSPAEGSLVALGGVDYSTGVEGSTPSATVTARPPVEDGLRTAAGGSFLPLPGARSEVEAIAALHAAAFATEPILVVGAEATKQRLVDEVERARYVHIATHGWFAPESSAVSMLDDVAQPEEALKVAVNRARDTIVGFLPETLCGLALAGANNGVDEHGRVPGILTAEELATLDLTNCELAVLSACETNVGIRRAGQGIQSLQTALHAAGARTAITSLWKVDDAATRRLFELFYTKLWSEKLGPADALWQAKMALRSEGHPTRDWAGWVLTGDPD